MFWFHTPHSLRRACPLPHGHHCPGAKNISVKKETGTIEIMGSKAATEAAKETYEELIKSLQSGGMEMKVPAVCFAGRREVEAPEAFACTPIVIYPQPPPPLLPGAL